MKIMLVCASGMSTGLLMNKMNQDSELEVKAYGMQDYQKYMEDFDVILMAPQISYKEEEIKSNATIPVSIISAVDYGIGNIENIKDIVKGILK